MMPPRKSKQNMIFALILVAVAAVLVSIVAVIILTRPPYKAVKPEIFSSGANVKLFDSELWVGNKFIKKPGYSSPKVSVWLFEWSVTLYSDKDTNVNVRCELYDKNGRKLSQGMIWNGSVTGGIKTKLPGGVIGLPPEDASTVRRYKIYVYDGYAFNRGF